MKAYLAVDILVADRADEVAAVILVRELAERAVEQNCVKETEKEKFFIIDLCFYVLHFFNI
jgi:hypothetical protein